MFANGLGDLGSIPRRVIPKTLKMVLDTEFKPVKLRLKIDLVSYPVRAEGLVNMDTALLNTQQYKVRIKWSNPGKGVAPSPSPQCRSY